MPADPAFYPALSGVENLDLLAAIHGCGAQDRSWALELLDLSATVLARRVGEYSSGMTQKLALVQAVQHHPDLVILDEPANRLDPLAHRRFERLVREIADSGRTVFLSSHTLSEVEDVCDRVVMVRGGHLLAVTTVTELSDAALRNLWVRYRRAPADLPDGLLGARVQDDQLWARIPRGATSILRELLADKDLLDLTVEPGSLEDAFVALYEDDSGREH